MDVPDISLVYPLMMLVQIFTGDYVLSYKLTASILAGGFTVSLFLLALKWGEDYRKALLPGCLGVFSPHLTYFACQYPKNLLGLVFFVWLLYVADSRYRIVPILLLALNFVGHRVTAVLGFVFLLGNVILERAGRMLPYVLIIFVVLFVAGGALLPGVLNFFDVERFRGVVSGELQFAPYSFLRSFGTALVSPWWLAEIILSCVFFFASLWYVLRERDSRLAIMLFILAALIFPFFEWSTDGPAFRFFLMFVLLSPVTLIFLLKPLRTNYVTDGICVMLIAASFFSFKSYDPARHDPPYKVYGSISAQLQSTVDAELIIAHKALAEYIVYSTGVDAMSWIPEYKVDPERLWRIAEGVRDIQFDFYLEPDDLKLVHRLTPSYTLLREDCWQKFLQRVKDDGNNELLQELTSWKNPDKVRPYFLLRNKGL
jgi:hypothetical protein